MHALGNLQLGPRRGHPVPRPHHPGMPASAAHLLRQTRRRRAPPRKSHLAPPDQRSPHQRASRHPHRRIPLPRPTARPRRAPAQLPPQRHAPHDPILHRTQRGPNPIELRQSLRRRRPQNGLLQIRPRGHPQRLRHHPRNRRHHLPQRLLRRGRPKGHLPRLLRELLPHARLRQPLLRRAHAPLPLHPHRSRGRQRQRPHHPPRRIHPRRPLPLLRRRLERPCRTAPRPGQPRSPQVDPGPANQIPSRGQGGQRRDHHGICLGDPERQKGHSRIRTRRVAQNRPAVHLPEGIRIETHAGRSALQNRRHHLSSHARNSHRAREGVQSVSQCRFAFGGLVVALRIYAISVLYGVVRGESSGRGIVPVVLGSGVGIAFGEAQESHSGVVGKFCEE
mmetsp:Transcript_733/g.1761  ORF Transcript_733/g.1761 Transcript_733/m.1761 type:complete len:392 (-) Transcript_733:174-1349(-)